MTVPLDPVPSPRSGGDDDEVAQLPQPRAAGDGPPSTLSDDQHDDEQHDDEQHDGAPALASPRPAPDDRLAAPTAPAPAPAPTPAPEPARRVYADGSALAQYVDGSSSHADWLDWAKDHEDELITTPLGLTELRRIALPAGVEARGVARAVESRVTVVRFSDQTLRAATKVSGVLPPFTALHIGAALAHPGVVAVATYETQLARVAALHGLLVVSPGRAPFWWESDD